MLYQPALRGSKGTLFEGGVRVPGIVEWPAHITEPRSTDVTGVTTDMLPTLLDLMDLPLPDRPLDGVSLRLLLEGEMSSRPAPLFFWKYNSRDERNGEPWIAAELQKGNTPTWKNPGIEFLNFAHPIAKTGDFGGTAAVIDDRYKLILPRRQQPLLFDIVADGGETHDLYARHPAIAKAMTDQLRAWQASVEVSLTGADY